MGKRKYIETPEKMWEYFCLYRNEVKENPIYVVEQKRGNTNLPKDISSINKETLQDVLNPIVKLPLQRPLTLEGFENWCADNDIIESLDQYFSNQDNIYAEYMGICSRIKKTIRQDQIEGGMAGIYNPSITQRLNNLTEKVENTNKETNTEDLKEVNTRIDDLLNKLNGSK